MANDFEREACFWTSTIPGYNTKDRQRTVMRDGVRVTERFPQRGHAGDYEDRRRAPGTRFLIMVDHNGHSVAVPLTNAAAHLDHTASYGQHVMGKARSLGWFQPGACPCALLSTGEMTRHHILSDEVRKGQACKPGTYSYDAPCPHSVAEHAARRAKNDAVQLERERSMKDSGTKHLEATQALTEKVVEALLARDAAPAKAGK